MSFVFSLRRFLFNGKKTFVDWLYTTAPGRVTLKVLLHTGALKLGEIVARSPLSKPFISRYIKNNNIDMSDFKGQKYNSFQDFFSRKRDDIEVDRQAEHLISPCDGYLSAYRIKSNNSFHIKGSWYKVTDLVTDKNCKGICWRRLRDTASLCQRLSSLLLYR